MRENRHWLGYIGLIGLWLLLFAVRWTGIPHPLEEVLPTQVIAVVEQVVRDTPTPSTDGVITRIATTPAPSATPDINAPIRSTTPRAQLETAPDITPYTPPEDGTFVPPPPRATLDLADPGAGYVPPTEIPAAVTPYQLGRNVTNILLLGRDTSLNASSFRTDVMIVASIDTDTKTVTMISIPRDLYVYIPTWRMNRINTAAVWGQGNYPAGGIELLKQTILYNLGIPIDYHVQIDFGGFKRTVDTLDGVTVPVSCPIRDWRLISPELDPQNADNWEQYTLPGGMVNMDGDLALWYARSRKTTSDFDRSRRQQQVLRAMYDKALSLDGLRRAPQLYAEWSNNVTTDVGITTALSFLPLATNLGQYQIRSQFIGPAQTRSWRTPEGASVLLPDPFAVRQVLDAAFNPPQAVQQEEVLLPTVLISNASGRNDTVPLAIDNLTWFEFVPSVNDAPVEYQTDSELRIYNENATGSEITRLKRVFSLGTEQVALAYGERTDVDFEIVVGNRYQPCLHPITFSLPIPTATVTPVPEPTIDLTVVALQTAPAETEIPTTPSPVPTEGPTQFSATRVEQPIAIDAEFSDWNGLPYALAKLVNSSEQWNGAADSSAQWGAAYDDTYLYLALSVQDDVWAQHASGPDMFLGDTIELLLDRDLNGDLGSTASNGDDFQIGLSPGNLSTASPLAEGYIRLPAVEARLDTRIQLAFKPTGSGYLAEIAVPWEILRGYPQPNATLGFALSLFDNDIVDGVAAQTLVSTRKQRDNNNPTTWDQLILLP